MYIRSYIRNILEKIPNVRQQKKCKNCSLHISDFMMKNFKILKTGEFSSGQDLSIQLFLKFQCCQLLLEATSRSRSSCQLPAPLAVEVEECRIRIFPAKSKTSKKLSINNNDRYFTLVLVVALLALDLTLSFLLKYYYLLAVLLFSLQLARRLSVVRLQYPSFM